MATYPSSIASFSTKQDGVSTVAAADPNNLQAEVVAIEPVVGANPNVSALGAVPAYVAAPNSNSFGTVSARIANVESGLTNAIQLGYTTLVSGTISGTAGSPTSYSVTSTGYRKLVVVIYINGVNSCGNVLLTVNSLNSGGVYNYSYIKHSTGTWTSSTSGNAISISAASAPALGETIVAEISEPAIAGHKAISYTSRNGFGSGGVLTSGVGSPVTTIDLTFTTGVPNNGSTYIIYGVK
jgi:hypothetical protein